MKIETVIADTNVSPARWYTITVHEADDKIETVSRASFALALEYAIREMNSIENDAYRLQNEPGSIFAEDMHHTFPVIITVVGDYHNVLFFMNDEEE